MDIVIKDVDVEGFYIDLLVGLLNANSDKIYESVAYNLYDIVYILFL